MKNDEAAIFLQPNAAGFANKHHSTTPFSFQYHACNAIITSKLDVAMHFVDDYVACASVIWFPALSFQQNHYFQPRQNAHQNYNGVDKFYHIEHKAIL